MRNIMLLLSFLLVCGLVNAATPFTRKQLEEWYRSDFDGPPEKYFRAKARRINEGRLRLLPLDTAPRYMHARNIVTITPASIDTGWVRLRRCLTRLDAFPHVEIIWRYRYLRRLRLIETHGIGEATLRGRTIVLRRVGKHASLCAEAEVRVFFLDDDGSFVLANGPFFRRFLDGYFPLSLSLEVRYPAARLRLDSFNHRPGKRLRMTHSRGRVRIDAVFEGRMITILRFSRRFQVD